MSQISNLISKASKQVIAWCPFQSGNPLCMQDNSRRYNNRHFIITDKGKITSSYTPDYANGAPHPEAGCWGVDTRAVPKPGELWYLAKAESKRHLISVTIRDGKPEYVAYEADGKVIDQHS